MIKALTKASKWKMTKESEAHMAEKLHRPLNH